VHGGYPAVHANARKAAVLTGLVESFVVRDASDRFRIRRIDAFRALLELMASQVGNLCNYSEWAAVTGVSADTVRFWRSKSGAEVDFVVERAGKVCGVEVKVGNSRGRITRSAHSFIDAYRPDCFWVVSDREHASFEKNGTFVRFLVPENLAPIYGAESL